MEVLDRNVNFDIFYFFHLIFRIYPEVLHRNVNFADIWQGFDARFKLIKVEAT
jgi:hypothetical protein